MKRIHILFMRDGETQLSRKQYIYYESNTTAVKRSNTGALRQNNIFCYETEQQKCYDKNMTAMRKSNRTTTSRSNFINQHHRSASSVKESSSLRFHRIVK